MKPTAKHKAPVSKRKTMLFIVGLLVLLSGIIFFIRFKNEDETEPVKQYEVAFTKQGELDFFKRDSSRPHVHIDIEIAENSATRQQGLMYRHHMSDSIGMLFIFEDERPLSFWMKNTYIALDILYINSKKEIVSISSNTTPLSETSIPSHLPAIYVVEVAAGFCYRHAIETGDRIEFARIK